MAVIYPANPDFSKTTGTLLQNPTEGQFWYNTLNKHMYVYNGTEWIPLTNRDDYAANWGQIEHGQTLPKPVSDSGHVFEYDECIWSTSPAALAKFNYFNCYADANGLVTAQYRPTGSSSLINGIANYIIIGIRGNHNNGTIIAPPIPSTTPTPTPTVGASMTPTPTITVTPTVSLSVGVTTTPTKTPAPTATVTPSVTKTPLPTPTVTPSKSGITPMIVTVTDPEGGTDASSLKSYCNIANYSSSNRDMGYQGCSATSTTTCLTGQCSPEPGDNGLGPVMVVSVSGGVAPYTVQLKNFVKDTTSDLQNSGFESGDSGWTKGSGWVITSGGIVRSGTWSAKFNGGGPYTDLINNATAPIIPGQYVTASGYAYMDDPNNSARMKLFLIWYNSSMGIISRTETSPHNGDDTWTKLTVSGYAPAGAAYVRMGISSYKSLSQEQHRFDDATWNLNSNSGTPECIFVGGANVASLPTPGVVKTYSIASSGQSTPVITLNGICSNGIFNMNGMFDIVVTDSAGHTQTITKKFNIFRINQGGGGGGGDDLPGCVATYSNIYGFGKAEDVTLDDNLITFDPILNKFGTGKVSKADVTLQPCVRITTESNIVLDCSTTAPLCTDAGEQILAPDTLNRYIKVMQNNEIYDDKVINVEHIGNHNVMYITCEDSFFLAGNEEGKYILHHNLIKAP